MKYIKIYLLTLVLLIVKLSAQNTMGIDDFNASFAGMTYVLITNGAGIGGFYEKYFAKSHKFGAEVSWILARGENEYPVYINYGQYMVQENKTRLSFLNFNLTYKKVLFVDKIANNFRPFLSVSAGPVIALDSPNISDFSDRMKKMKAYYSINGNAGAGIDFLHSSNYGFSFFAGVNFLIFNQKLDPDPDKFKELDGLNGFEFDYGKKDFSSAIVKISIIGKF